MMYSVAFIFAADVDDKQFFKLDAQIEQAARDTPDCLAAETWRSPEGTRSNATYCDGHRGFPIVIAQVLRWYRDGAFEHVRPNQRPPSAHQRKNATTSRPCHSPP